MERTFRSTTKCAICEREFVRTGSRSRYCSTSCAEKGDREKARIYRRAYRQQKLEPKLPKQARKAVENAIKQRGLIRPDRCPSCFRKCVPQAHHYLGYEREHWLDVIWLCSMCHDRAHDREVAT